MSKNRTFHDLRGEGGLTYKLMNGVVNTKSRTINDEEIQFTSNKNIIPSENPISV